MFDGLTSLDSFPIGIRMPLTRILNLRNLDK